jgi:predicted RNA binding protein YcfA (HicA-like mRNA interferase family)
MSRRHRPLTVKEVETALKVLGFKPRPQGSTSHVHWVKDEGGRRFKVTVDPPKAPFSQDLIGFMARQAGVSKRAFYRAALGE